MKFNNGQQMKKLPEVQIYWIAKDKHDSRTKQTKRKKDWSIFPRICTIEFCWNCFLCFHWNLMKISEIKSKLQLHYFRNPQFPLACKYSSLHQWFWNNPVSNSLSIESSNHHSYQHLHKTLSENIKHPSREIKRTKTHATYLLCVVGTSSGIGFSPHCADHWSVHQVLLHKYTFVYKYVTL